MGMAHVASGSMRIAGPLRGKPPSHGPSPHGGLGCAARPHRMSAPGWRPLVIVVACVAALVAAPLAAAEPTPATGPLRWGADSEGGAPYIFKSPDDPGKNIGFEVELAQLLARELGRPIEFHQYDFKSLVPGLERGDFDLAMNGLEVTPDRKRQVLFTRPYYIYRQQLVVRADETRIRELDDCRKIDGVQIGTMDDTAAERLLDEMGIAKRIYDNQTEPYEDLVLGRTDAVLLDTPIALYIAKSNPKLKFAGKPVAEGYYAIGLRKEDTALRDHLDKALNRLIASGELKRLYQSWNLWTEADERLASAGSEDILSESARRWTPDVYLPELFSAARVTIEISLKSMTLAIAIGLVVALCRLYGPAPLRWLALAYVEFFRGIPVLLLLVFIYFGLPAALLEWGHPEYARLSPITASVIAFGLNYAAFEAEIYRSGIGSIPVGQWEAAASLGMSKPLAFRRVILPQAIRVILPPTTNDFVALFKDTSIVSVVSVIELTKQYQILSKSSLKYLEIGAATALVYLLMSIPLGYLSRALERKWSKELAG